MGIHRLSYSVTIDATNRDAYEKYSPVGTMNLYSSPMAMGALAGFPTQIYWSGFQFEIDRPWTKVLSAKLKIVVSSVVQGGILSPRCELKLEDTANASVYTLTARNMSNRTTVAALPRVWAFETTDTGWQESDDFSDALQAILYKSDWQRGNYINLIMQSTSPVGSYILILPNQAILELVFEETTWDAASTETAIWDAGSEETPIWDAGSEETAIWDIDPTATSTRTGFGHGTFGNKQTDYTTGFGHGWGSSATTWDIESTETAIWDAA